MDREPGGTLGERMLAGPIQEVGTTSLEIDSNGLVYPKLL